MKKYLLFICAVFVFIFSGCEDADETYTLTVNITGPSESPPSAPAAVSGAPSRAVIVEPEPEPEPYSAAGKTVRGWLVEPGGDFLSTPIYSVSIVLDENGEGSIIISKIEAGSYHAGVFIDEDTNNVLDDGEYFYSEPVTIDKDDLITIGTDDWDI